MNHRAGRRIRTWGATEGFVVFTAKRCRLVPQMPEEKKQGTKEENGYIKKEWMFKVVKA